MSFGVFEVSVWGLSFWSDRDWKNLSKK